MKCNATSLVTKGMAMGDPMSMITSGMLIKKIVIIPGGPGIERPNGPGPISLPGDADWNRIRRAQKQLEDQDCYIDEIRIYVDPYKKVDYFEAEAEKIKTQITARLIKHHKHNIEFNVKIIRDEEE